MDFVLPEMGEGVYECELVEWSVRPGQTVRRGQTLAEVLTDKATMDVPSPFAGRIIALQAEEGQQIRVGDVILQYATGDDAETAAATEQTEAEQSVPEESATPAEVSAVSAAAAAQQPSRVAATAGGNGRTPAAGTPRGGVPAAPSVRRMARSLGIELSDVRGSGKGGRVLIDDLCAHVQRREPADRAARHDDDVDLGRAGEQFKLIGVRRLVADKMVLSARTIPHYSYVDECHVTELVRLRGALKGKLAARGIKLTYLAFLVKAVLAALREVPIVNATFDAEQESVTVHDRYHVGIATSTRKGLMVPVIRDADQHDLPQLAAEIQRLSDAARNGSIQRDELMGSTFTVTSIGSIGGLLSTPIINAPEVGILGVGKIVRRPICDDAGQVVPAEMLYLSYSFDHRIVDGAAAAIFGNAVNRALAEPAALLLPP